MIVSPAALLDENRRAQGVAVGSVREAEWLSTLAEERLHDAHVVSMQRFAVEGVGHHRPAQFLELGEDLADSHLVLHRGDGVELALPLLVDLIGPVDRLHVFEVLPFLLVVEAIV